MGKHSTSKGEAQIRAAGRAVGHVEGDTFFKHIQFSRHALQRPPALALDVQSLADAEAAGASYVAIEDTESGRTYRAAISTIRARGFKVDRGYGRQIALTLPEWHDDG